MEGYERLRAAIVKRAVQDYCSALRKNDLCKKARLERFFKGSWGQLLSYGKGEYIIEECKRICGK